MTTDDFLKRIRQGHTADEFATRIVKEVERDKNPLPSKMQPPTSSLTLHSPNSFCSGLARTKIGFTSRKARHSMTNSYVRFTSILTSYREDASFSSMPRLLEGNVRRSWAVCAACHERQVKKVFEAITGWHAKTTQNPNSRWDVVTAEFLTEYLPAQQDTATSWL